MTKPNPHNESGDTDENLEAVIAYSIISAVFISFILLILTDIDIEETIIVGYIVAEVCYYLIKLIKSNK